MVVTATGWGSAPFPTAAPHQGVRRPLEIRGGVVYILSLMRLRIPAAFFVLVFLPALAGALPWCPDSKAAIDPCHCPKHDSDVAIQSDCCCSIEPVMPGPQPPATLDTSLTAISSKHEPRIALVGPSGPEAPPSLASLSPGPNVGSPLRHGDPVPLYLKHASLLR